MKDDRRGIDKWFKTFLGGMAVLVITNIATGIYAAGVLNNKVETLEKTVSETKHLNDKVIVNSETIKKIAENQDKTLDILEKIDNRQRKMEIKLESHTGKHL